MNEKQLKILAGVFAFLLLLFFVTRPRHRSVNIDDLVQSIVIGVAEEDVREVEVYKDAGASGPVRMNFIRQNDVWRITTRFGAKAQKYKMDKLVKDVLEMTGKVRSSDPRHFDQYGISDAAGIHMLMKDETGKTLANLIIGKKPEDAGSGFIRIADKEKVYFVDKDLLSGLNIYGSPDTLTRFKDDSFVDLQAVDRESKDLALVGLVSGGREMVIRKVEKEVPPAAGDTTGTVKKETEWMLVRGRQELALDQKEVENFLRDVTEIRGTELVDRIGNTLNDLSKSSRYGFDRPSNYVVFRKPDGPQDAVIFGKAYEKDQGFYMNVQEDGLVYKVAKYNYDKIFKWVDELPKKMKK